MALSRVLADLPAGFPATLVVVQHLDRYWERMFGPSEGEKTRTTNGLEQTWRGGKRRCRKRHGRKELTQDMRSLPAEVMLVGNLQKEKYVELTLGGKIEALAKGRDLFLGRG